VTISQGRHQYHGHNVGRAARQNSKLFRGGFTPISVDRLVQLLADSRQDQEVLVQRVTTTREAV
jgi:hypothetical protein